jgi:hypothetical protein
MIKSAGAISKLSNLAAAIREKRSTPKEVTIDRKQWWIWRFSAVRVRETLRSIVGRILSPVFSLVFLGMLFWLAFRTLGPGGTGLPSTQPILEFSHWIIPLLTSSLALGFAVMAIIQLFKPEIRATFHLREIARWIHRFPVNEFLEIVSPQAHAALLELPIEQLAAQIQAASDAALVIRSSESKILFDFLGYAYKDLGLVAFPDDPKQQGQLAYFIQRRLDDLQIQVRRGWRRLLRLMSVSVSLLLTFLVASVLGLWDGHIVGTAFLVLLFTLVGAFFASVARDIVAILERLRNS